MLKNEFNKSNENVCDLKYLNEIMSGKKHLIKELIDASLVQISEELKYINDAIIKTDFASVKKIAHSMKSSVSIMGIYSLNPILQEMEDLGTKAEDGSTPIYISIEKMKLLFIQINSICTQAIEELEKVKLNYD